MKLSGETDFPCMSSRRVGKGRVYVHLGPSAELEFSDWCRGLAAGRSYVSDGYAHLPRFTVNGVAPGAGQVELARAGSVSIRAAVAFAPQTPASVAYGTTNSPQGMAVVGDTVNLHEPRSNQWIEGGQRRVEIIVNGVPVSVHSIPADGKIYEIESNIQIQQSIWIAVRQFPQLHSNPVNVIVDDKPIRASRQSALWCIEMTELLWNNRERSIVSAERPAAREAFDQAIDTLRSIADQSEEASVFE